MRGEGELRRDPRGKAGRRSRRSKRAEVGGSARRSGTIRFAEYELDVDVGELRRAGKLVAIARKPFSILCHLVANAGRAVPKQELLRRLWPKVVVSDAAFASALKDLRRALGDEGARPRFISTVRGRGVRFVGELAGTSRAPQLAAEAPTPPPSGARTPLVGRIRELRALARAAEAAARGKPKLVVITGAAGTGKSRLVEELLRDPSSVDFAVGRGECQPDEPEPYRPFADAFRGRLEQGDGGIGPPGRAEVEFHQILNAGRIGARSEPSDAPNDRHEEAELFTAVWRVLERLARARPTLLVIEDLHHATASTLELLTSFAIETSDAQHGAGVPLLLIATTQPPENGTRLDVALRRIGRQRGTSSIEISGLGSRASGELLAGVGAAPKTGTAAKSMHEATSGNPYLLSLLAREPRGVVRAGEKEVTALRAPIERRLEHLSRESRSVLTVASFCGGEFGSLTLGAAAELPPQAIAAALDEASALGLVVGGPRSFRFDHELVRESLREATPDEIRAEIHLALAGVLEELHSDGSHKHAVEIARHLLRAGPRADPDRVAVFARRAGDQAFEVCAWSEATEFYEAALGVEARLSAAERAEIHFRTGVAIGHDLDYARAYEHFSAAAREFRAAGDGTSFAWALMNAARVRAALSPGAARDGADLRRLESLYEQLGAGQPALRGRMLASLAAAARHCRDDARAEDFAEQAFAVGRNIDDDAVCYLASEQIALARYSRLRLVESVAAWLDADTYAHRSRDPWLQSLAGPTLAYALQQLGRLGEARTAGRQAEALARRARNRAALSLALAGQASLELASGNLHAAEARARDALAACELTHDGWARVTALVVRGCVAVSRARWNEVDAVFAELMKPDQPRVAGGFFGAVSAESLRLLAIAHRAPQTVDRGELSALLDRALAEGVRGPNLTGFTRLAEVALLLGSVEHTRALEEPLRLAAKRGFVFVGPRAVLLPRLLAGCALLDGRLDEAESYFEKSLSRARLCGARIEIAATLVERAQMQARTGRVRRGLERARADAAEAGAIAREIGLVALAQRADALTRTLPSGLR
ncbi:MAG: hypothetical protein FJ108_16045 [Deltaproteobacteria bacterium]|nr:hypothetical protein [Deltaproteobacteria bacterium]